MKRWTFFLAVPALLLVQVAHADLIELRAGVGLNAANPNAFQDRVKAISGSDLKANEFDNFNADLFLNLPGPFGVGLRHEWINGDKSSNGSDWKLRAKNFSVLADWRLIDTVFYLGPIVSIGYPNANVKFNSGSIHSSNDVHSGQPSYGLGAEAGVKLAGFLVGAEAGYQSLKFNKVSGTNNNIDAKVDLSGFYGKVMIGLAFL